MTDVKAIGSGNWKDFDQFLAYLKQVEVVDMGGVSLQYIFDIKKIPSEVPIKEAFQKLICANCQSESNASTKILTAQGKQVFQTIWNNVGLRGSLFPVSEYQNMNKTQYKNAAKQDFISDISNISNSFYNFIKVK